MIPAVQLSQVVNLPDVLVDNHFSLLLPFIPGGGDAEAFWVRNMNASLPGQSNAVTKVTLHRHDVNFANRKKQPQSFTATFVDSTDRKIINGLKGWQNMITDPLTGLPRPKFLYAVTGTISLYSALNLPIENRTYFGLWVNDVAEVALNGASENAPIQVQATFTYDYWLPLT